MAHDKHSSLSQLVALLQQLCQQGRTGRLITTTDSNRLASVDLDKGRIIAIDYADKTGVEALALLATFKSGSSSFMELATQTRQATALPTNQEIFSQLGSASPSPPPSSASGVSTESKVLLEKTLAGYIGPMAKIICNRVWGSANDLDSAIAALASQIPDAKRAQAFLAEIRAKL